jgi:hypothetical protein
MKGIVRPLPGEQFPKVRLQTLELDHLRKIHASENGWEASRSTRSEWRRMVEKERDKVARRTHTAPLALPEW